MALPVELPPTLRTATSIALALALVILGGQGRAANFEWIAPADASFHAVASWNPTLNAPPSTSDQAIFDRYALDGFGETAVTFSSSPVNSRLIVRDDEIALNLASNIYRLTNASDATPGIVVAEQSGDVSNLRITAGRLEATHAKFGLASGSDGVVTINTGSLTIAQTLLVGASGVGELIANTGSQITAGRITLGDQASAWGIASISDVDTLFSSAQQLVVGAAGRGEMYIYDGATVNSTGAAIAREENSDGVVTVIGGSWTNTGNLDIGGGPSAAGGTGDLVLDFGGTVTVTGRTRVWDDGLLSIRGGTLNTGTLENLGGIEYIVGVLHLTAQDLVIGDSGLLGPVLSLTPDMHTIVDQHTTVDANGHIAAIEGIYSTGSITNNGRLSIVDGAMDFLNASTNSPTGRISIIDGVLATGAGTARRLANQGRIDLLDAVVNGDIHNAAGTVITTGGAVAFNGRVTGDAQFSGGGQVTFNGRLDPGDAAAALSFGGDVSFTAANSVLLQIGGSTPGAQFDQLSVAGSAALGGTLNVVLLNGFLPSAGQTFRLIEYGVHAGTFNATNLPTLPNPLVWSLNYADDAIVLSVNSSSLSGDLNLDGAVDRADLAMLLNNYGLAVGATAAQGDLNGDFRISLADAMMLRSSMTGPGSPAAVPEPSAWVLCALAIAALPFAPRRPRRQ